MAVFRKFIALALFISAAYVAVAQQLIYSPYEKFDYRSDSYAVMGVSGGYIYTYHKGEDGARLYAYDDEMNKVATVLLDFLPQRIYKMQFITYPDKIMVLYQSLESNKVVQYVAMLDENGRLQGKPTEIARIKTGIFGATRTYFSASWSDNKKYIVIYSALDKGSRVEFEGTWLDENAKTLGSSSATFKAENTVEHGELNVANDGTVFVAAYTPTGSQNYADQYWLLRLGLAADKFSSVELPMGEKFAAAGYTRIDNVNNKVYFGGFYSDHKSGNFNGVIFASCDITTSSFNTLRFIPFDAGLINAAGARRSSQAFNNFVVRQLIVKNDGGFVLVSESTYVTTRSTFMPGFGYYSFYSPYMNSTVREYHYNDIMALAYDNNGKREWDAFIPKQQFSQEDDGVFSSYALLNSGGTLAFLFNDFDIRHSRIQLATINASGTTETHGLVTETINYPDWLPRSAKQITSKALVVPCFRKKQICFVKVSF